MRKAILVNSSKAAGDNIQEFLADIGYSVAIVSSGPEAIERYHRDRGYDLIVIEMELPGLSGASAAKMIRQMQMAKRPMIVGFSADETYSKPALESGMDFFMVTPPSGGQSRKVLTLKNAAKTGMPACKL